MKKDKLFQNEMDLIVSLPKNDYEFAKAAWENGADAIKIHVNVHHYASDTHYGSMQEEMVNVRRILDESPIPVGIVLGEGTQAILDDFPNIAKEDFAFMSVYYDHAPSIILQEEKLLKTVAINSSFSLDLLPSIEKLGVEALELSIMTHDEYGTLLTIKDLARYQSIIDTISIPTILPTQKKIQLQDIKHLKAIGIKALMIGAIVTGKDIEKYGEIVKRYAAEIHAG